MLKYFNIGKILKVIDKELSYTNILVFIFFQTEMSKVFTLK